MFVLHSRWVLPSALTGWLLLGLSAAAAAHAAAPADAGYRKPPQVVADILTAARVPRGAPLIAPDGSRLVLPELPSLISIDVLAEPVDRLAGLEVLSSYRCLRSQLKSALTGFSIVEIANGKRVKAQLPAEARVGTIAWSPSGEYLACVLYAEAGGQLWLVEAKSGQARLMPSVRLNTVLGANLEWTLDESSILCRTVVETGPTPAATEAAPAPRVRVGKGKAGPQRTVRDVLHTPEDRQRFERAATAQLMRVPVTGGAPQKIGPPSMLGDWIVSPDERHIAVDVIDELPYGYPYSLFPSGLEIWDESGKRVATVSTTPLNDRSAISSVAPLGPREPQWSPDGQALWFFSWEDAPGADPFKAIRDTTLPQPGTDRLARLDAPFTDEPRVVTRTDHQLASMTWTMDGKHLLLSDRYQPRRRSRLYWIDPTEAVPAHHWLVDRSTEGVYDHPGQPLTRPMKHQRVLWSGDGSLYFAGEGFRPEGQQPFLDAVAMDTGKRTRVWESTPDVLEAVVGLLAQDGGRFVTLRQSNTEPPNYFARRRGQKEGKKLSEYADPAPALTAAKRIQFKFTRSDSVSLNAEIVLPAEWKGERLPTIFWVYPSDYRSAAAASENRRSPHRFPSQSPLNPEVLVTQGYAVVYPDIAVVGSNDRYVEEIALSARAAIEECARRGYTDKTRVGVGGHSYGAFSTANLLAHTDLFRAGVASDGAYNRTLTPFTFQAEERTLWQARDTYIGMSPFVHADRIQEPLLLLHNLDDTNVGTHPMQSDRMYEALNGLGKTVSLVEYPYEDHTPAARETALDYWARVIEWYHRYVLPVHGKRTAGF